MSDAKPLSSTTLTPGQVTLASGIGGGVISNLTGIPFDRFRVLVANDLKCTTSLGGHLKTTFGTLGSAFIGGGARVAMKSGATALNLGVPQDLRKEYPFLMSFAVGAGFSPILNVPRMFQLGKIAGVSYPETFKKLFTTGAGFKTFLQNTAVFAPGEGLRMMMCFGTKDFLMPKLGGDVDPSTLAYPSVYAAQMAGVAGPVVAVVETTAALVTETISTVQANMKLAASSGAAERPLGAVLKETITPAFTGRCWLSLFAKNCAANTPLFWVMFMGDFYGRMAKKNQQ